MVKDPVLGYVKDLLAGLELKVLRFGSRRELSVRIWCEFGSRQDVLFVGLVFSEGESQELYVGVRGGLLVLRGVCVECNRVGGVGEVGFELSDPDCFEDLVVGVLSVFYDRGFYE